MIDFLMNHPQPQFTCLLKESLNNDEKSVDHLDKCVKEEEKDLKSENGTTEEDTGSHPKGNKGSSENQTEPSQVELGKGSSKEEAAVDKTPKNNNGTATEGTAAELNARSNKDDEREKEAEGTRISGRISIYGRR